MVPNYRRCTARDLETLANLSRETFITAFGAVNDPVDLKTYCNKAFHPTALKKELGNPDSHFYFALQGETPLGYFKLNQGEAQTEALGPGAMELERLYVLEAHQGKGLGARCSKRSSAWPGRPTKNTFGWGYGNTIPGPYASTCGTTSKNSGSTLITLAGTGRPIGCFA